VKAKYRLSTFFLFASVYLRVIACKHSSPLWKVMDITVTAMNRQHVEEVHGIEQCSFVAPWPAQLFRQELETTVALSLVAVLREDGGETVAGYFCAWIVADDCSILRIASRPQLRRRGIATLLLQQGMARAWERGARVVSLEVRPSNGPALAFYRACGFDVAGVRRGYYPETGEDALVMQMILTARPEAALPS
jgi:[ribosomal protein S18]-alanine N-acetyltransferase